MGSTNTILKHGNEAKLNCFLEATEYIDFLEEIIQNQADLLFTDQMTNIEKTKIAYEFVRDHIPHSFDCDADIITAKASDVLKYQTGICHAKANLLAALLRSQGIPAGFCFQHSTRLKDDAKGYCVHAYNAVYLANKWIKLDARGNKEGVNAQFSTETFMQAFFNRTEYDEYFWEGIYSKPHIETMDVLRTAKCRQDVFEGLPDEVRQKPDIINNLFYQ